MSDYKPLIEDKLDVPKIGVFCPQCGASIKSNREDSVFCNKCGERIPENIRLRLLQKARSEPAHSYIPPQNFIDPYPPISYKKKRKWNIWAAILLPLVTYIIIFIFTVIIVLILLFTTFDPLQVQNSPFFIFLTAAFSLLFLFVPTLWVNRYYEGKLSFKNRLKYLGLPLDKYRPKLLVREILLGIALGILGLIIVTGLQYGTLYLIDWIFDGRLTGILDAGYLDNFGIETAKNPVELILLVLMMVLFVGLPEEIMFRGFVQRSFERKLSRPAALFITAVYFSIYHIYIYILVPEVFLFLFVPYLGLSIIMGLIRNWRKDLFAVTVMHIIYNSLQIVLLYIIFN
jgi:membrane protease YdiL (CAAX protease family)/ribosomal protein S27AE